LVVPKRESHSLLGGQLAQTADRGADSAAVGGAQRVSATSNGLGTGVATPDADGLSAEGELTAEGAEVLCVLGDLNLLGALTGVRTIAGTVAAHDAHLDGTLSHISQRGSLVIVTKIRRCTQIARQNLSQINEDGE
jgi:hypothetical protein